MNVKSIKYVVMVLLFSLALISCSQNVSLDNVQETSSENVTTTAELFSYQRISLLDSIRYEIPSDWQTCQEGSVVYHYFNDENYLMVSSVCTEFDEDSDQTLTDQFADTLLGNLKTYDDSILLSDCTSDIDGVYCRKIVCSYSDGTNHNVVERSVTFSVGGVVYSFDYVSYNVQDKNSEDFKRIIGSIVLV